MKVALDFDGTVSLDPAAFKGVALAFLDAGHDVAIVTWRPHPESTSGWEKCNGVWTDIEEVFALWGFKIPIVYCSGRAKRDHYPADVWIDDNPAAVLFSLTRPPRFESDPANYLRDMLVCERKGFEPVMMEWEQLRATKETYDG